MVARSLFLQAEDTACFRVYVQSASASSIFQAKELDASADSHCEKINRSADTSSFQIGVVWFLLRKIPKARCIV